MYNMYSYFSIYIFGSAAIHSHNRLQIWVDQILQPDFAYAGAGAGFLLLIICIGKLKRINNGTHYKCINKATVF